MVDLTIVNATSGISSIVPNLQSIGWILTIVIFIFLTGILFFLFKNFRKFIMGLPITAGLLIVGFFSRYISNSTIEGDYNPLKWVIGIIIFCIVSTAIWHILLSNKKFNKFWNEVTKN